MPDTYDYPLVQTLGTGNLMHHARPAVLSGTVETRCGLEGERTDRDGSFWCPDCLTMERAEAGTHDERGGDEDAAPCLFCERARPDLHAVFAENETCYARYDNYPATPGHVEIVPKRHVESLFDLAREEVHDAYALITAARRRIDSEHGPDGYTIGVNEGHAAGRTIDHLHIHLIPRRFGDVADPRGGVRGVVSGCSPDAWCATPESLPRITDGITAAEAEASATFDLTIDEVRTLKADLAATTAHAEKAEAALAHANSVVDAFHAEADRMSDRYDNLRGDYDRLRAQVAELGEPTEWGQPRTEWTWSARKPDGAAVPLMYPDPHPPRTEESVRREFDGVVDNMGYRKVLLCREVTAWRDANGGWSSRRPDASLDGLRGPFTGLLGPLGIGVDTAPDGQVEAASLPVADCPSPYRDGTCRHLTCGRCNEHTNNNSQGHYWAYCKVTKTKREHHFCCPGDCELEPPNIRHDDTNGAEQ